MAYEWTEPTQAEKVTIAHDDVANAIMGLTYSESVYVLGWIFGRLMGMVAGPEGRRELAAIHARSIEMAKDSPPPAAGAVKVPA
jgi:hypothetical protein